MLAAARWRKAPGCVCHAFLRRLSWPLFATAAWLNLCGAAESAAPATAPSPTATRSSTSAAGGSIDTAKQQFDLLKSARDPAGNPKAALPSLSVPEFHSTPPAAAPARSKPTTARESDAKTGNWLVDAMEKSRDPGEARRDTKGERVRRPGDPLNSRDEKAEEPGAAEEQRSEKPADEKETAGLNPLAPYLTQWMTPQDYALLGARIQRTADGIDMPGGVAPASTLNVPGPGSALNPAELARTLGASRPPVGAPPAENPFLQALNAPPSSSSLPSPPPAIARAPAPVLSPVPSSAPAPTTKNSPASDLLKPSTDDKYFRPLKRF